MSQNNGRCKETGTSPSYWRTQREKPQNHRAWFGIIPQLRSLYQLSYLITHLNKIMPWKSVTLVPMF